MSPLTGAGLIEAPPIRGLREAIRIPRSILPCEFSAARDPRREPAQKSYPPAPRKAIAPRFAT
jgi:hypothetical protein